MKNYLNGLLFAAICLSNTVYGFKGKSQNDTLTCLNIKGKIKNADQGADRNCLVELLTSEGVIESTLLEGKKNFEFSLQRDRYYAIRISKPGFVTKLISINTSFPQDIVDVCEFTFNTDLMSLAMSERLNKDALDFPIAIIHFDDNIESFIYNKPYTDSIKREIYSPNRSERSIVSVD